MFNSRFLTRLRLKWCTLRKSLGYGSDFVELAYRIYLNHDKVIHYRDGCPVFSLTTPALFSKPMANFLARALYRNLQNRNVPNVLSFAVNDVCNAACRHCSFFEAVDEPSRSVLSTDDAKRVLADAQELGVSVLSFVGGEPLLRDDLPELLRSVDKDLSTTVLFTNGALLEKRAAELRKAGLDSVFVSIDYADPSRHDDFRGTPGLFEKAMAGIRAARKQGMSVGLSSTLTPESFRDGELPRLVELGKEVGVHEVFVFDALPTGRFRDREDVARDHRWVDEMIHSARPFNEDRRLPGVTFFSYITSHRSIGCSCGTNYFYVSPYGDVMSCDFNHATFGNVVDEPMWQVWERLTTRPEFAQSKWGGCKIKDPDFRATDAVVAGREHACCDEPTPTDSQQSPLSSGRG